MWLLPLDKPPSGNVDSQRCSGWQVYDMAIFAQVDCRSEIRKIGFRDPGAFTGTDLLAER